MKQPIGASEWNGRKAPNDETFLSASTVASKVLANPVLENWTVEATAKWVIENMGSLAHMATTDPDAAFQRVKNARFEASAEKGPLRATDRGTKLHEVIEHWLVGENRPTLTAAEDEQLGPYITEISTWFVENKPEPIAIEQAVFNDYAKVGGRFDMALKFRAGPLASERIWLCDTKTKNSSVTARGFDQKPYGDAVSPQLAAYRWAEWSATFPPRVQTRGARNYLLNTSEREHLAPLSDTLGDPNEIGTLVLMVTPEWSRMFPVETGREVLEWVKAIAAAGNGKEKARKYVDEPVWTS